MRSSTRSSVAAQGKTGRWGVRYAPGGTKQAGGRHARRAARPKGGKPGLRLRARCGGRRSCESRRLRTRSRGSQRRLVQCKRWTARNIGVELIRELGGTLLREGRAGEDGIFVTCARYTQAAIREADRLGIELVDGPALLKRLETAGAVGLLTAAEQASTAWVCPECATPMILGHSAHGWWLRCPRYTDGCRGKHDLGQDSRTVIERLIAGA
jgi:Restriction endonuclease